MTEHVANDPSNSISLEITETDPCVELYSLPVSRVTPPIPDHLPFGPCPVCRGGSAQPLYQIGPDGGYYIVVCKNCGLGCLSPPPTSTELAKFYVSSYYGDSGNKFAWWIELVVRLVSARQSRLLVEGVPPKGRILDVGCGRGVVSKALLDRGLEVHGYEISSHAVQGIDPRISVRIAPSLAQANYPAAYFDKIVLWHVLEHIPNPREVLIEARRLLKPSGAIVIAVPNFSSWQALWAGPAWFHLDPPRHLFHFPQSALVGLLTDVGFSIRSVHHFSLRQNPFGGVQSLLNRCRWLPRNGLYVLMQKRPPEVEAPYSLGMQWLLRLAFLTAMPWALLGSIIAAIFRRGATIHVVASPS